MFLLPAPNLILSIIAQNENQALEAGSTSMGFAFGHYGYRHRIIDMFKPSGGEELLAALTSGEVAFAYAFAGVGSQLTLTSGANIWTASRTPFVCLWHDHPAYNYKQHIVDSPYVMHGYHVRDHREARQKYLPASSSPSTLFTWADPAYQGARDYPVAKRAREILYAKTAYQPSVLSADWQRHSADVREVLWNLVEQATADRNIDLADATAQEFARKGYAPDNLKLFMGIIQEVDAYVRAWRSDRLARALLPFPARIFGRGWDYLKGEKRRAEFYDPISAHDYAQQTLQCRIIANSNPLWRDGIHNRVDNALNVGSIVLTDRTVKSDAIYGALPNYVGFDWKDSLEDAIAESFVRADDDRVDYFATAAAGLDALAQAQTIPYPHQIIKAAEVLREGNVVPQPYPTGA